MGEADAHTVLHGCRSDLDSAVAEQDHLLKEVGRMQAELQSEGEAIGEGEDSVVEAAAVTGVHIRNFRLQVMPHLLTKSKILHHRIFVSVVYRSCSYLKRAPLCTGYHVCTPGSAVKQ